MMSVNVDGSSSVVVEVISWCVDVGVDVVVVVGSVAVVVVDAV